MLLMLHFSVFLFQKQGVWSGDDSCTHWVPDTTAGKSHKERVKEELRECCRGGRAR